MARINKPIKSKLYNGIYTVKNKHKKTEYLARFTYKNRVYQFKNLSKMETSINSERKAHLFLVDLIKDLAKGIDPFEKKVIEENINQTITELITNYWELKLPNDYASNLLHAYNKHIKSSIGTKTIKDINLTFLESLFMKLLKKLEKEKQYPDNILINLKKLLRPIFDIAVDKEYLDFNPLDSRTLKTLLKANHLGNKLPISQRLEKYGNQHYIEISKKIYKACLTYSRNNTKGASNEELQLAFILTFMTARRTKEILQLKYEDLTTHKTVKARAATTKSKIAEEYPLPDEFLDRLDKNGTGLIFPNIKYNTYLKNMRTLLDNLKIETHLDAKVYGHDKRVLFSTIMAKISKERDLVDSMISHESSVKGLYQDVDLEDKIIMFTKYWKILRG